MANSCRYLIPILAIFFAILTPSPAQNAPKLDVLTFSVFARQRQMGLQFLPAAKQAPQSLEFFGNTRSPHYKYKGGSRVPFYDEVQLTSWLLAIERDPLNPPPLPNPVAVAQVAPGIERALFLFIPVRNPVPDGPKFNIYVVDDSPRQLPVGYAAVINVSGREYMAQMGDQVVEVPQGIGGKVQVKGTVELRIAAQSGGGWVVGGRHTFRLGDKDRVSLVFFPPTSPTGIAPIIRTLIEELPEETAASSRVAGVTR